MKDKVSNLSVSVLKREMFENARSYKYFIKGFEAAKDIQILKDSGAFIFMNNELLTEDIYFRIDNDGTFPVLGTSTSKSLGMSMWLGSTMGLKDNTIFVYKKELDIFKNITYIEPTNIHKLSFDL